MLETSLGKKEIEDGIRNKGWVLYRTDKSGKAVLDTKENYIEAMKPHFQGDKECEAKDVIRDEKVLSNHSRTWNKIFNIGGNAGQGQKEKCSNALTAKYAGIPILSGLRKDHKSNFDPVSGPPMRPVGRARNAPNTTLGYLLSTMM